MRHFTVTFQPDGRRISIHEGATLLDAAYAAGIILNSTCGGLGTCRKCAVRIGPDDKEVLACQYAIDNDLSVTVPETSRLFEHKIVEHGIDTGLRIKPAVKTAEKTCGMAVDIGTTTVVAKLVNLADGSLLAVQSDFNPQARYGDDVITRITFANTAENLTRLQRLIVDCLNNLIEKLCAKTGVERNCISQMVAVGNTTMTHILLGFPVAQLGRAPYRAYSLDAQDVRAADLKIKINPDANIRVVENVAGFVGSDIVAAALAVDINLAENLTLLVDIGTNGEIVCGSKQKLYAASCAAGPAFEGAKISRGSRAVSGAIQAVTITDGDIDLDVIGDAPPRSICGSGLLDAVAVMLDLGVLNSTGRIVSRSSVKSEISPAVARRLIRENEQPVFVLAFADDGRPAVILTQQDIREVQLAKAAIAAGIELLFKKLNLRAADIDRILLAGAFGNYIKRSSALRIGLLPEVPPEKIQFVGNAASSGAQMILLNRTSRELAAHLARKIEYIEIAHEPEFVNIFTKSMTF
jgi:uncharacterized 2Fe-2S/4Fe-4S cluster protein (DUF4445 family)